MRRLRFTLGEERYTATKLTLVMKKPVPLPPVEVLNELFNYNPDTGLLSWKVSRRGVRKGEVAAGCIRGDGYIQICVRGKAYKAHRIVWKMVYGEDPDVDKVIDHINRVKDDNRISNLRVVTVYENNMNGGINAPGETGISNIFWSKQSKRYCIIIKRKYIGSSKTLDGAVEILKQYMCTTP